MNLPIQPKIAGRVCHYWYIFVVFGYVYMQAEKMTTDPVKKEVAERTKEEKIFAAVCKKGRMRKAARRRGHNHHHARQQPGHAGYSAQRPDRSG